MKPAPSAHRRHDIPDSTWKLLEPHLPRRKGTWGGNARDNRQFINAIFWILRAGAPWRDLPPDYGGWKNTHRRFYRWCDRRVREKLPGMLIDNPDLEWLMIDASHIKVHPHAAGARGDNQDMGRTKGRFNTKAHLAVDAHGMPLKVVVTAGSVADGTQAGDLVRGMNADYLIADKGYDSDEIVDLARDKGMQAVIPPRKNRKQPREYDKYIYRLRHRVENTFLHLKQWRGIATRYPKNTASFLAAVHVRCIAVWAKIY